jgi:hypothetical protein
MDKYYNYALDHPSIARRTKEQFVNSNHVNIETPYTTQKDPLGSNMAIPSRNNNINYSYLGANTTSAPQQKFKFKGFTMDQVPFLFLQDHRKDYKSSVEDAVAKLQTENELSDIFFSEDNINYVRKEITKTIYNKTHGKIIIDDQPYLDILIKMQSVYYLYGRFLPDDIDKQVSELNYITIRELVPEILVQIKQQLSYIRDISRPPDMMNLPSNVSSAGRRTNRSISSIYNI